ncbi:MAG: BspA family leucine-rich repeat surface protein [Prevotella sp.]
MKKFYCIFLTALLAVLPCSPLMAQDEDDDEDDDEEYEEVDDFGYVTFSADSLTMTFYYDTLQAQRADTVSKIYTVNYNNYIQTIYRRLYKPEWHDDDIVSKVTTVRFDSSYVHALPTFTSMWFDGFTNLTRIEGIANLNTSDVDDMMLMFGSCRQLAQLDLSHFNTAAVDYMAGMFYDCTSLTQLDLSSFDTRNVKDFQWMFKLCSALSGLNISTFDISAGELLTEMFSGCTSFDSIDISGFAFKKEAATQGLFKGDRRLKFIRAGSLDFGRLGSTADNMLASASDMFAEVGTAEAPCDLLVHDDFNYEPFHYDDSTLLYKYAGGSFTISRYGPAMAKQERYAAFTADTTKVTFYYDTLRAQRVAEGFCLDMPDTPTDAYREAIAKADSVWFHPSFYSAVPRSTAGWFEGGKNLKNIDLTNLHTAEVTDMSRMFSGCESIQSLYLDNLSTINVTTMKSLFSGCKQLRRFNARNLVTSEVTNMNGMFKGCESLQRIYFDGNEFYTGRVTDMQGMLQGCRSLKELDLTRFYTTNVKYASNFLEGADSLRVLKLGRNDFYNAVTMRDMFKGVGSAYADSLCQIYVDTTFLLSRLEEISAPYYHWNKGKFVAQVYDKQMQRTEEFCDKDGTGRVLLERYFDANIWQMLALPFALSREQVDSVFGQGTHLAKLDSFTGDTLYFKTVERMEANVPIIIRPTKAVAWPVFNGVNIVRDFTYNSCVIDIVGDEITAELDCYFRGYIIVQKFYNLLQDCPLAAMRPYENDVIDDVKFLYNTEGYFMIYNKNGRGDNDWDNYTYLHDVPIILRSASGETTRISIPVAGKADAPRYNLAGQRVGNDYKGVVIHNGRKFIKN